MKNRKMRKAVTKNLTPEKAWHIYVDMEPELFISEFHAESEPVRDIRKMCEILTLELPGNFEQEIFTNKQLDLIKELLIEYLTNYIDKKGGMDNLELLSIEELDAMDEIMIGELLDGLASYAGINREEYNKALKLRREKRKMMDKVEKAKEELVKILTEYEVFRDNSYDFKIKVLMEQISVLEDIINDELDELLFEWELALNEDKKESWKYR